ncbi:type II toxin-antitoxin system RelE/ParE family toxin [Aequorivita echinoideorum]|uniref:Type II toxin-antitoxin system RelE/ParE family toxin n=1 Tax=Aequorivita echinoideorum TaxID=1549647 RepID=A0ABS5S231_9FLAO|nr:type II toxin-antitoxin system RelE/ParE family toxin [Aequorivita echinoideorum]MBT0607264.1 type II toxin-antitoxin system RelE/ParE family toxin [Aequorivita echinoideorum]
MIYKIFILHIAKQELDEAVGFYESRRKGFGNEFLTEVKTLYNHLQKNPFLFRKNNLGYYEASVSRFPFLIIYEVKENSIYIASSFHTSRNPKNKPK